jgi:hypothetical protein
MSVKLATFLLVQTSTATGSMHGPDCARPRHDRSKVHELELVVTFAADVKAYEVQ